MNTQKQIVLIIALTFIFVGGCAAYTAIELPVRAPDQADWTRDQSLERGALLFANNCRTCHGNTGQGGVGPQLLNAQLTQFQDQDPLKLAANKALLNRTLSCGRAGTLMPAWLTTNGGSLNAIQIQHIVNFLTSPVEVSEDGEASSRWWEEAEGFAHNLNGEVSVLVGGDTLGTIAKEHGIGPKELAAYNNLPVEGRIKKGAEIKIPPFKADTNGYVYTVYKDNETITKIAESQHVGALILADFNGLAYKLTAKRGVATFQLRDQGRDLAGLFPGTPLKLNGSVSWLPNPIKPTYTIAAGDTLDAIAARHGISVSSFVSLNPDLLGSLKPDEEIPFERVLKLPKQIVIVQEGQTLGTVAQLHDIELGALVAENALAEDAVVKAGTQLKLPADARYVVQSGDTFALVATLHGTTAADLAKANGVGVDAPLAPEVIIQMPQIDAYIVQGQTLDDVKQSYGNVSAESLAEKNGVKPTDNLAIGTQLKLPDDAWGSAPPDARNPGTACVQYAVSSNVFDEISGKTAPVVKPTAKSTTVKLEAHSNDWTLTADGVAQPANKGVALIAKGTTVSFASIVALHNIKLNGTIEGADLKQGDSRTLTFNDAGEFLIQCSYHPPMWATLFVE